MLYKIKDIGTQTYQANWRNNTMAKLDAYFGEYGGQYVPQILVPALEQLEQAFIDAQADPEFRS